MEPIDFNKPITEYGDDNIQTLEWQEHVRMRPGMYIGKLGDGSSADDGIYILLKEVIDNSIDEFVMGAGKQIEVRIEDNKVSVRDFGRGIPLGKVVDVVSKMNTGGKYDSRAFKKSVGLNGVGTKAVNALSSYFYVASVRDGQKKSASFSLGVLQEESPLEASNEKRGTLVTFQELQIPFRVCSENAQKLHLPQPWTGDRIQWRKILLWEWTKRPAFGG